MKNRSYFKGTTKLARILSLWRKDYDMGRWKIQNIIICKVIVLFFICFIIQNCKDNSTSPGNIKLPDGFLGQLESDLDNAILKPDGTVWTWGSNLSGQLGNGTMTPSEKPVKVSNLADITAMDLYDGAGVAADIYGNIWFWGDRLIWEEEPGKDIIVVTPVRISYLIGVKQIQINSKDIYLLKDDGTLWKLKWDHNNPTRLITPEIVSEINNIKMLAHDLILKQDGKLCPFPGKEWVQPDKGGTSDKIINDIEAVQNVFLRYTVVLKKDSTVYSWGISNPCFLGNNSPADFGEPIKIDTLKSIVSISANSMSCLALKSDGTVWFWGLISLGENKDIYQNKPMRIEGIDNVEMIHASPVWDLLFMKKDGTYWSYNVSTKTIKTINLKFTENWR